MKQSTSPPTVTEEVQAETGNADLIAKVEALERGFHARAVHALANGRGEHWWTVVRRAFAIIAWIVVAIWIAGGEWRDWVNAIETIPVINQRMNTLEDKVREVQLEQRITNYRLNNLEPDQAPRVVRQPDRTPKFAPEWSVGGGS
jgi:hypothetical protein